MDIRSIMAKAIPAVEFMYDQNAEIQRYMEYEKPNGAIGHDWIAVHKAVPCRLSNTELKNTSQGEANKIDYDTKMFLSGSYEVKAGDKVIVDGNEYEFAREPFVYVSHQEVLLIRKGYA